MLVAEPFSGPAAAALHLVEHEQEIPLVTDSPQSLEEALRRGHHAPFAEDRLHEDAAGLVVDDLLGLARTSFLLQKPEQANAYAHRAQNSARAAKDTAREKQAQNWMASALKAPPPAL